MVVLFLTLTSNLFAAPAPPTAAPDFAQLRSSRIQIVSEIDRMKAEAAKIRDTTGFLPPPEEIEQYVKRSQQELEAIKTQLSDLMQQPSRDKERISQLETDLRYRQSDVDRYQSDLERKRNADRDLNLLQNAIAAKERDLLTIESQISEALARDVVAQNFKSQISLYFALLVGFMILCFFGVAFFDAEVRVTIFSGQAGIQFITLFSLIIAIILFGITGILGDKELAALLGGLSGYILGRYTQSSDKPVRSPPDPSPPAAPN